ncbi:MAG: hypothetical protein KF875_03705 [Trueperaceae bacterium]|nr:hypothetical protein [Trueperaceae bacterium]
MDQVIAAALRRDVDEMDEMLRGDGNGKPGIAARLRTLELRDQEVVKMLKEWESTKNQLKGVRLTLILIGIILSALGGGLGLAILEALRRLAAGLP